MEYTIKINEFEGPMDLLLHLIKKMKIDIWDISIEEVTKTYLDYIKAMDNINLDVASEYLVMAAELIELKSRLLLPKETLDDEDEYEEDPKEQLIRRLIEYKKYKEVTSKFKELEETRSLVITKDPENINNYVEGNNKINLKEEVTATHLFEAFQKFLQKQEFDKPLEKKITQKEISVNERCADIRKVLFTKKKVLFEELFEKKEKSYIITTFLAVLEMVKHKEIILKQDSNFEKIYITLEEGAFYE